MPKSAPPITAEYRQTLHRALDKAIDDLGGHCDVSVNHGTRIVPDEDNGMLRRQHNGAVSIVITPPAGVRQYPD